MLLPNDPNSVEAQSSQPKCNGNFISGQNTFPALLCRGFVAFALMGLFFALQNEAVKSKPLYLSFMAVCSKRPGPWLQMRHQTVYNHPHCRSLLGIWTKILPLFKLKFNQQHLDKRQLHQQKQKVHQTLEFSQTLAWFDLVQRTDIMSTINKAIQWSDQ